jgi:hypothetical protein
MMFEIIVIVEVINYSINIRTSFREKEGGKVEKIIILFYFFIFLFLSLMFKKRMNDYFLRLFCYVIKLIFNKNKNE